LIQRLFKVNRPKLSLFLILLLKDTDAKVLVFKYNDLCRQHPGNRSSIVCFRDDHYFCLCNMTIQHAQCLRFDPHSDKCQHCLSGGHCIRGNVQHEQDFLCLCPRCMFGSVCQFSTQLFSFTIDALIIKDVQIRQNLSIAAYVSVTSIAFLSRIFSNLCSLMVFSRKNPRKVGVGNYLLLVSIFNLISLLLLLAKIIHILLGSAGLLMNNLINVILCKSLSSFLSISVRVKYWLISIITVERLSLVIFPTKSIMKKPTVALVLSFVTILIVCGMHVHEMLHYTIISAIPQQINSSAILCATNFEHRSWSIYNHINVLIHHLVPFVIQVIVITFLIVWAAKSRARTVTTHTNSFSQILKKQFRTQKELYVTPVIIILATLPQMILTSSFACTELTNAWQRYTLLISYLFSFTPQICGFVLYVLPSSAYKAEFINTTTGRRLLHVKIINQSDGFKHSSLTIKRHETRIQRKK
jgi:hypothetical protein